MLLSNVFDSNIINLIYCLYVIVSNTFFDAYFRLWIDTHDDKIAEKAQLLAKQAGVPVRYDINIR
jgi:hypothetical protein